MTLTKYSVALVTLFFLSTILVGSLASAHEGEHVIEMFDGGVRPGHIEIDQGETITFKNLDTKERWPASNIHPTHEIYSDFDPKRPVPAGESWSFTFDRAGEWKHHDHIYSNIVGTIVVNPVEGSAVEKQEPEKLQESFVGKIKVWFLKTYYSLSSKAAEEKLASLNFLNITGDEKELHKWLRIFGPEKVMNDILVDADGGTTIDCHQQAHEAGRAAYTLFGAEVFEKGDASCHSGFYHGAMESFLQIEGTNNLSAKIDEICDTFPSSFGRFECLHGVGHGLLAYENYDLPLTLEKCKELKDQWSTSSCYGGVFMENIVTAQGIGASDHQTEWANRTDLYFPCNAISTETEVQYQCYQMQTSWMLSMYGYNFDRVAEACQDAPQNMVSTCFKSFGRDAAGHSLRNSDEIIRICDKVESDSHYNECVYGALNVIVDFWGEKLLGQGSELCDKVPRDATKNNCYSLLSQRLTDVFVDSSHRQNVCQTFDANYQNLCASL